MFAYLLVSLAFTSCKKVTSGTNSAESNEIPHVEDGVLDVRGIDVSHFQGVIPWDTLATRLQFAFCKATEGETYVDPSFQANWGHIKTAGLYRGAYHFYRSDDDPEAQANFFIQTVGALGSNDLPLVLDVEAEGLAQPPSDTTLQRDIFLFLEVLEANTGKRPIIYTSTNFANRYLTNVKFGKYPLWIASYQEDKPNVPEAWKNTSWDFWQKTDHYTVADEAFDFDVFKGNPAALKVFVEND